MKGKFRIKKEKSTNPIAVGDVWIMNWKNPRILLQEPFTTSTKEKNYIVRKSVNLSHQMHIIASILIVFFIDNNKQSAYYI
jgi:ribosome biogenesis GTPase